MNNLDKQYLELLKEILEKGTKKSDRTMVGTVSVFGREISHKMSDGFPLLTTKKMYFKGILMELIWFLSGNTNQEFLVKNNCNIWVGDSLKKFHRHEMEEFKKWKERNPGKRAKFAITSKEEFIEELKTDKEFCKKWGELGPIYGKQWRRWDSYTVKPGLVSRPDGSYNENYWDYDQSIDQIQNLINELKTNPDSRRLIVSAWNVGELDQMVLPPCHYGFQVYTRKLSLEERRSWCKNNNVVLEHLEAGLENEEDNMRACGVPTRTISLKWTQRSCDFPLGIPYNIASYALLLELIAKSVNMVPDELIGSLGDCHIYLNQIELAKEQIQREGLELPTLKINEDFLAKDSVEFFNSFFDEEFSQNFSDFGVKIENYKSHPAINYPLSN